MSENNIDPEILSRYLEGKSNPQETKLVEKWYAGLKPEMDNHEFVQSEHFATIENKLGLPLTNNNRMFSGQGNTSFGVMARFVMAAMVLLICGIGVYWHTSKLPLPANSTGLHAVASILNSGKQIQKQLLPDGSTVWLQPSARLTYNPQQFASSTREVTLEGDAFFDVARNEASPFFVLTTNLKVEVLGTSFHVKASKGQPKEEVTVISGKVKVSSENAISSSSEVALLPAQKAVLEVATGIITPEKATSHNSPLKIWQPASLEFLDVTLGQAVRSLEEKYAVSIQFENPNMEKCLMTATFDELQLSEVLEIISVMLDITYEVEDNTVVLKGNGCKH